MRRLKTQLFTFFVALVTLTGSLGAVAVALPADTPPGSTIEQRIAQRKAERQLKLDSKDLLRVKGRCTNVQAKVRTIQDKLGGIVENRDKVYQRIDAKLWISIGQLKLAGKDTFNLEKQRAVFTGKVAQFDATVAQYKQTLDDIVVINCGADVEGFMALIATARDYHDEIRKQTADMKSYVVDTVKVTLTEFTNELQPKAATEDNK